MKHQLKPFLWKLDGEGIGDKVYLFGTAHFSDPRVVTLHPAAEKAFRMANRVYTESDLSSRGRESFQKFAARSSRTSLVSSLGKDLAARVETELKSLSPAHTLKSFEDKKTWALWTGLSYLANCGEGRVQLDSKLWKRATSRWKSVIALETLEEQLGGLNKLSESEQVSLVASYLNVIVKSRNKKVHPTQEIFTTYLSGDEENLLKAVNHNGGSKNSSPLEKKLKKSMIDDRNKRLATRIENEARKSPKKAHFFAVGVSHYIGKKSIIDLLKKKGYQVTRITQ